MSARNLVFLAAIPLLAAAHDHSEPKTKATASTQAPAAEAMLSVKLTDSETGEEIPGCIRIADNDWLNLSQQLLPRGQSLPDKILALGWHTLVKETAVGVPNKPLKIEAFAGLEYDRNAVEIEAGTTAIVIPLRRLFNARGAGWAAGNTHLHLRQMTREMADRYLLDISRADGLDMVFVSYLERALVDREYTTNAYSKADLERISTPDLEFGDGEEYRHNFGGGGEGYGHVMLLDLAERILPASVGPGITKGGTDGTPLQPGIEKARAGGATVIWCHNLFGMEDLPNWLKGNVHAQNIFDGGNRGGYQDTYYRYLDIGLKTPFSTGTDWFMYDFSRVYVKSNGDEWLDALRDGRSIITNGPWIEFEVDGLDAGSELDLREPKTVEVTARAIGRHDFGSLEIIQGGKVIKSEAARARAAGGFEATINGHQQLLDAPAWLAARIQPKAGVVNEMNQPLFGHTSPVYVRMNGKGVFRPEVADGIRVEIEESANRISKDGQFANDTERERVLQVYQSALQLLKDR